MDVVSDLCSRLIVFGEWIRVRTNVRGMRSHCLGLLIASAVVLTAQSGCEFMKPLPPHYAEQHGSRDYPLDPNAVYQACISALQSYGFSLRVVRPDLGRIETGPSMTSMRGQVIQRSVIIESDADAWTLQLVPSQTGTRVIAYPRSFHNGVEYDKFFLSKLDQRWGPLFAAIDGYLPRSN